MKFKIQILTLLLNIVIIHSLFAQNKPHRVGTTAANFLEIGIGGAGSAMGEAYVSTVRDISGIYWNPAGLGYLTTNEAMFVYHPWIADIDVGFAAAGMVIPQIGTFAIGITSVNYGRTEVTTMLMQEGTGETYAANEYALSLSYGRQLVNWFAFGASAKFISSKIWHMSANAMAVDLGVIVNTHFFTFSGGRENGMSIGMSISNYGTKMRYDGIDLLQSIDIAPNETGNYEYVEGQYRLQSWELPLIFRVGASINPISTARQRLTISVDALHPNNNSESINLGSEYMINIPGRGKLFLRGGYHGLYMDKSVFGLTLGGGFVINFMNNKAFKIDYTYKDIGLLGKNSIYSLSLLF